ncbi:MAG: carboxypeptidase regulatory-like domain-containing protein [Bacteroidetes bacterium]|nr:carboxypeptidase regulatory-like domain-containing protein [Bacteroidota bacterium]
MKTTSLFTLLILFLCSLSTIQSCNKDKNNPPANPGGTSGSTVIASICGVVKDATGLPLSDAIVTCGNNSTNSDASGIFYLNNIQTSSKNTVISVYKDGYFKGSKTLSVKQNQTHPVFIFLMPKGNPSTFDAASGASLNFANGLVISFPPNAIVDKASGTPYNGQVSVYAKYINPTTTTGRKTMPGNLLGLNINGIEKTLESFGMMAAEIYGTAGNELQLISGVEAGLYIPVPSGMLATALDSIPLWYYDETKGYWMEDGQARLQGSKYYGKIKHFSFWNVDGPHQSVFLEMILQDQNGAPMSGYTVRLTNVANSDDRDGISNNTGWLGVSVMPMPLYFLKFCQAMAVVQHPYIRQR